MTPEQVKSFIEWLRDKQKYHKDLASGKQASTAYGLNHSSRSVAFLEVRTELLTRLAKEAI